MVSLFYLSFCDYYPLGCQREAVPTVRFHVCFALICDDRVESFSVLQARHDFTKDSRETGVIL